MKYQAINGWTKETIKQQIRDNNNGKMATDIQGNCQYLAPDGNKCVVGCFIPDGHIAQQSRQSAHYIIEAYEDLRAKMPLERRAMSRLQDIHDSEMFGSHSCAPAGFNHLDGGTLHERLFRWIDENVEEVA